jgi:ribonuclease Z
MSDVTVHPTLVTLTGTGVPFPAPGRAGAGTLVRYGDLALQFDAGRATAMRLAECGVQMFAITAVFITHVHSDHLVGLADVAMSRWTQQSMQASGPLDVVAPEGAATRFVERMLEPYDEDIHLRVHHVNASPPEVTITSFAPSSSTQEVWRSPDSQVIVEAVAVHHEPVQDAVAYRVTTPTGVVVISGDTRVCGEVEHLSDGADVLVHEACRATALKDAIAGTRFETIFSYHADTSQLGPMAERAKVKHLVLTHLIPAPVGEEQEALFTQDIRDGGYHGELTVGRDLMTFTIDRNRT